MGRFNRNTRADFHRQHLLLVGGVLAIEHAGARHRDNAHLAALLCQLVGSLHRQADFRTGGDEDQLRLASAILQDIAAAGDGRFGFVVTHMER